MNPIQGLLALLVGIGLFPLVVGVLETVLVDEAVDGPVASEAAYFGVRDQPAMLGATLGYN